MTNQNNSTPDGKRLEKKTANYLNMVKNMQLGEEKLKKYRKKEELVKRQRMSIENRLEEIKQERDKLGKILKREANAYSVKIKKRNTYLPTHTSSSSKSTKTLNENNNRYKNNKERKKIKF